MTPTLGRGGGNLKDLSGSAGKHVKAAYRRARRKCLSYASNTPYLAMESVKF